MWYYRDRPVTEQDLEGQYGFVYVIENLSNGRKYIGKKFLWSKKTKQVKGKKKRYLTESDWESYFGSNEELKEDIKKLGEDSFRRTILKLCKSKGETSYWEAKYQFDNDVLLNENFYNRWIMCRVHSSHIKTKE